MPVMLYNKPYRTPADLINDLKRKNLAFLDEVAAINILNLISYYRIEIYLHPLLDMEASGRGCYRKNEYFECGTELYRFDEKFRILLFGVIARLEVKLRSRLNHALFSYENNPFWYLDNTLFYTRKGTEHIDAIRKRIQIAFNQEQEFYAKNYRENYYNNIHPQFTGLPPFSIACEVITIGGLFKIFESIDFGYFKKLSAPDNVILDNLAKEFGANDFRQLTNWVRRLRDVRNRCAHHSRLWNARLAVPSQIARELSIPETRLNRPYLTVCMMYKMIKTLNMEGINLKAEIKKLFAENYTASIYMSETGFPQGWETELFWSE